MPLIAELPTRKREVKADDIANFVSESPSDGRSYVPNFRAFSGATIIARADGLFVMQIRLERVMAFYRNDLDELAYVVSMVAKAALGHVHYHHHLPGKGRPKPLKPTSILVVTPIPLNPRGWSTAFRLGGLSDKALADARVGLGKSPRGEAARHAVTCLRRAYLNVAENVAFRVVNHRQQQGKRGPFSKPALPGLAVRAVLMWAVLGFLLAGIPRSFGDMALVAAEMFAVPVVCASILITLAWALWINLTAWHIPTLKLLRTAHGYFAAADPLNAIIARLPLDGRASSGSDFRPTIENLASKLAGVEHRVGLQCTMLTIALAVASFLVAVYAIADTRPQDVVPAVVQGSRTVSQATNGAQKDEPVLGKGLTGGTPRP